MQRIIQRSTDIIATYAARIGFVIAAACAIFAPASGIAAFDKAAPKAAETLEGAYVGGYRLTDQDGASFSIDELKGKPVVVSFIYTGCGHACPTILGSLKNSFNGNGVIPGEKFTALTIGFDVGNDTPAKLKAAGARVTNDFSAWKFATADRATIDALTKAFGFYYKKNGADFDHINMVSIVGPDLKIFRQVYSYDFTPNEILDPIYASILGTPGPKQVSIGIIDRIKLFCYTYDPATGTYKPDYLFLAFIASGIVINGALGFIIAYLFFGKRIKRAIFKNAEAH